MNYRAIERVLEDEKMGMTIDDLEARITTYCKDDLEKLTSIGYGEFILEK